MPALKVKSIPPFVFDQVNDLLMQRYEGMGRPIRILQKEILERLKINNNGTLPAAFEWWWLDFEDAYRAEGWLVKYDRPAYNESYDAFFVFTPKSEK